MRTRLTILARSRLGQGNAACSTKPMKFRRLALPSLVLGAVAVAGIASAASAVMVRPQGTPGGLGGVTGSFPHNAGKPASSVSPKTPASSTSTEPAFNVQTELPGSQAVPGENFAYPSVKLDPSMIPEGRQLYVENCASCHGVHADGATGLAPPLTGVGPATVDFWIATGRMPLEQSAVQPNTHPARFTPSQTRAIVTYVASLAPGGPGIPVVDTRAGNLAEGANIFALNCAGCHVITAVGDALANSTFATSLALADPEIIGDAIRSGPGNMPIFTTAQISPSQLNSLARYVTYLSKRPNDAGGAGLGHVGPVAEGFVALFFGVGGLMLVAYWIGDRTPDPRLFEENDGSGHDTDDREGALV